MKFFKDVWSIRGIFYKFMKTQLIELCGFLTQEQNKSSQECILTDHWCAAADDRQGLCIAYYHICCCICQETFYCDLFDLQRDLEFYFAICFWCHHHHPPEHQPPPTRTPTRTSSSATCSSEHMQMQLLYKHKKETSYLADNLHMLWYGLWWKRYRRAVWQLVQLNDLIGKNKWLFLKPINIFKKTYLCNQFSRFTHFLSLF